MAPAVRTSDQQRVAVRVGEPDLMRGARATRASKKTTSKWFSCILSSSWTT